MVEEVRRLLFHDVNASGLFVHLSPAATVTAVAVCALDDDDSRHKISKVFFFYGFSKCHRISRTAPERVSPIDLNSSG